MLRSGPTLLLSALCLAFLARARAAADAGPSVVTTPASHWDEASDARLSVGWRDNILLSPFAPISRAFVRGEVESFWFRPFGEKWELVGFLNGDVLRYFSPPPESAGEQQWFGHAEARWHPFQPVRLVVKTAGFLQDAVIDLSETEATRVVAPTRVRGGYVTLIAPLNLPAGFTLEPMVQAKRTDYRKFPGDYDERRVGARLEWKKFEVLSLSVAGFQLQRPYSQREQFTAGGRALRDTHLRFEEKGGEARARAQWKNAHGRWTATASADRLENRDDASGYFDYNQNRLRLAAEWQGGKWKLSAEGTAKRSDYLVQTVGTGITPPPRVADDFETEVRAERELTPRWTVFAEHRWERNRSNEFEFNYRATTVLAGVQRNF